MKIFGYEFKRVKAQGEFSLDEWIRKMDALYQTASGISVDCESALQSPTVHSVVRAISGAISTLTIHVFRKAIREDRMTKEELPNHPVAKLLNNPNDYEDRVNYWLDSTSWLVRYNNHYAFKGRGSTGPIRKLEAIPPYNVTVEQKDDLSLQYRINRNSGGQMTVPRSQMHHARGMSRDGVIGFSPIINLREVIALEIAIERFGSSFFGNNAMPSLVFEYMEGFKGFNTPQQRQEFLKTFHQAYSGKERFKAALLPVGIKMSDPVGIDNDKNQFLQTRQFQRTVIAGAFGVPPHLVGDLQRATFSNVEQQSLDFIQNVVLPYVKIFEASMEHDLLTQEDRNSGIIIRFNIDAALRGDFASRQAGLNIQRQAGVISANEWREKEGMNPRPDPGGDTYYDTGPSGQMGMPESPEPEKEPEREPEPATNGNGREST